jgi:hydroxyacylglutathione hydrolase
MAELTIESYCGGLFQTNGYVVRGEGTYLFDAPEGVADWMAERGWRPDALILTHHHHDHVQDAGIIQKRFACPIWAWMETSDDLTLIRGLERMMGIRMSLEPYAVTHLLEGQALLELSGLACDLLHVPGHSPDSVCFLLEGASTLIGGDVLFRGGIGRTDFPNGDHDLLLAGIRANLWPLSDETAVLPGHGPGTTIGREKRTNPFLT